MTKAKGKLAGMPRSIMMGDGKQGWTLNYKQILMIKEAAENIEDVSMEQVEAVMMAMIDKHFLRVEKNNDNSQGQR